MGRQRWKILGGVAVLVLVMGMELALSPILTATEETDDPGEPEPDADPLVGCRDDSAYAELDFWVGNWDVFVGDAKVGENRIEKILNECAVLESWTGADGGKGMSLFYYQKATGDWNQVWVTQNANRPGGLKEKKLVARPGKGAVRFQGSIPLEGGGSYLDRTTLKPLPDGRVQQVIEISSDQGKTWKVTFDAIYVRRK